MGEVSKTWDLLELGEKQTDVLQKAMSVCADRPFPEHLATAHPSATTADDAASSATEVKASSGGGTISSVQQFYEWYHQVEERFELEKEQKYSRFAAALDGSVKHCDEMLNMVDMALRGLGGIKEQYKSVASKTGDLHRSCENLLQDKVQMLQYADNLKEKLKHFDDLDRLTQVVNSPGFNINHATFQQILQELDAAVDYMETNADFADADSFLTKFQHLRARVLAMIKDHFVSTLRTVSTTAQTAGQHTVLETSPLYVKFHVEAPDLKKGVAELEKRADRDEFSLLLKDCYHAFFFQRQSLLHPLVQTYLNGLDKDVNSLIRESCSYMIKICFLEHQLYYHFFNSETFALTGYLESLGNIVYEMIRPHFISEHQIDLLCEVIDILRLEIEKDELKAAGEAVQPFGNIVSRMIQDAQERLLYLSQTFIRDEIEKFIPSQDDLNYPERLTHSAAPSTANPPKPDEAANGKEASTSTANPSPADQTQNPTATKEVEPQPAPDATGVTSDSAAPNSDDKQGEPLAENDGPAAQMSPLLSPQADVSLAGPIKSTNETWYPTLDKTLLCLSKLFRCVEASIFEGIAQEAVSGCTATLLYASKQISLKNSAVDGQLFLIKHLLIMREQIAPFDMDFAVTEKGLDFTHMKDVLGSILKGERSLFTFNLQNGFIALMTQGAPRITENEVDSKKDLEKELKHACESFIMNVTRITIDPLLSFLTKSTAFLNVRSSKSTTSANSEMQKLIDQAFASKEKIQEVVSSAQSSIDNALPTLKKKMVMYLANPVTQGILFKPIKTNIVEAFSQLHTILESEFTVEERQALCPMTRDDVARKLDRI